MKELLYVKWLDAGGGEIHWAPLENHKFELAICESVGWLVHEDDECLALVAHRHDLSDDIERRDWNFLGDIIIPKALVKERVLLKKVESNHGTD